MNEALPNIYPTFKASIRSVGTACTLAGIGVYLHRRGFVAGEGKKTLALIAQQVTIPLLLFTKIIYCNQDWSDEPCPDITKSLEDVWLLVLWPMYVVGWGLVVGWLAARISNTPPHQVKAVLVSCAFSNCTGLPITLLSVVHANFPSSSDLGRIDPTLFLSVYLLTYPILQWGIGGWLLAPEVDDDDDDEEDIIAKQEEGDDEMALIQTSNRTESSAGDSVANMHSPGRHARAPISHNVLNNHYTTGLYRYSRRGIDETDASMYISSADLIPLAPQTQDASNILDNAEHTENHSATFTDETMDASYQQHQATGTTSLLFSSAKAEPLTPVATEKSPLILPPPTSTTISRTPYEEENFRETVSEIFTRCLQPPVVGAIAGVLVAATPMRGIFVDLKSRSSDAPLQWFFDGLYSVGQAAVPLNMMILGTNVSSSLWNKNAQISTEMFSSATIAAIILGKMLVMPIIGILSASVLQYYVLKIPDYIEGSFYLVLMIVFITPTANNVMVMVELSGGGVKEGMARVIMLQYAFAPIILCLTMATVVGIASGWS